MATAFPDELVFVPLGGVGEIGMKHGRVWLRPTQRPQWVVVDCGVTFAGPAQPGIELIMADPTFLEDNADDVLALVLTHSHEDHYGAVLDLWPAFDRPGLCHRFHRRHALGQARLRQHRRQRRHPPHGGQQALHHRAVHHRGDQRLPFDPRKLRPRHHHIGRAASFTPATGSSIRAPSRPRPPTRSASANSPPKASDRAHLRQHQCAQGRHQPERGRGRGNARRLIADAPHRVAVTTFASNVGRVISVARAAEKAAGRW